MHKFPLTTLIAIGTSGLAMNIGHAQDYSAPQIRLPLPQSALTIDGKMMIANREITDFQKGAMKCKTTR